MVALFLPQKSEVFPAARQPKNPPACMIATIVPSVAEEGLNFRRNCSWAMVVVMMPLSWPKRNPDIPAMAAQKRTRARPILQG